MQGQSPSRARQEEPGGRARFMPRVQSPCSQAVTATRAPTRGVKDSPARVVWACWHCSWAPSGALSRGCACCPASVRNLPRLRRRFQGPLLALCSGPPLPTACRQGVAFAWAEPRGAGRPKEGAPQCVTVRWVPWSPFLFFACAALLRGPVVMHLTRSRERPHSARSSVARGHRNSLQVPDKFLLSNCATVCALAELNWPIAADAHSSAALVYRAGCAARSGSQAMGGCCPRCNRGDWAVPLDLV